MEHSKGKWSPLSSPPSSPPSPCSITELFKKKESPAAEIIGLLFPPKPKVVGELSLLDEIIAKSQGSPNQPWNTRHGTTGNTSKGHEGEVDSMNNCKQRARHPFHLSSSIFYGGQDDIYTVPDSKQDKLTFEDIGVDDSEFVSRGNWWQGSLYY